MNPARPNDEPLPYDAVSMERINATRNEQAARRLLGQPEQGPEEYHVTQGGYLIVRSRSHRTEQGA